ncbi:MAG: cell division ATP-binding protein FtsE [Candidatus Nealsonbacteria bacterium]
MIILENITKIYPSRSGVESITALKDVSLRIEPKEFVTIAGKSGAGKSTLFKLILREERPTNGRVFFGNYDVNTIKNSDIPELRRRIGTVFQDYKLFPLKTIYENIAYVMEVMGADEEDIKRDVSQILQIVGLEDREENFPNELSGGERQRVAIARALIHQPELILADEPTGNLDPYHSSEIIRLLKRINESGTTVILATHNKTIINQLKKRVITLENGKILRDEEKGRFIL